MNRNRVKGKTKEIQGQVLRKVGKVTGSRKTRVKGALRETQGKIQGAVGRMEEAADRADRRAVNRAVGRGDTVRIRTTRTTTVKRKRA